MQKMAGPPPTIAVHGDISRPDNDYLQLNDTDHANFSRLPATAVVDIFQPFATNGFDVFLGDSLCFINGQGPLYNPPLDGYWAIYTERVHQQHWLITAPHPRTWEELRALILHAWSILPVRLQEIRDENNRALAHRQRLLDELTDDTDDDEHLRRYRQAQRIVLDSDDDANDI